MYIGYYSALRQECGQESDRENQNNHKEDSLGELIFEEVNKVNKNMNSDRTLYSVEMCLERFSYG